MSEPDFRRSSIRLAIAVALLIIAIFIPAPASSWHPDCAFECWDSTWFPQIPDCIAGPPATCRSCMLWCPSSV
jgi:hypothetical protein